MIDIVTATVRRIEEPANWKMFRALQFDPETMKPLPSPELEVLNERFDPLLDKYRQQRKMTMVRIEQFIRRHSHLFFDEV